jgi:hypothetical protein
MPRIDRIVARARCSPRKQTYQTGRKGRRVVADHRRLVMGKDGKPLLIDGRHRRAGMWYAIRQEMLAESFASQRSARTKANALRKQLKRAKRTQHMLSMFESTAEFAVAV